MSLYSFDILFGSFLKQQLVSVPPASLGGILVLGLDLFVDKVIDFSDLYVFGLESEGRPESVDGPGAGCDVLEERWGDLLGVLDVSDAAIFAVDVCGFCSDFLGSGGVDFLAGSAKTMVALDVCLGSDNEESRREVLEVSGGFDTGIVAVDV